MNDVRQVDESSCRANHLAIGYDSLQIRMREGSRILICVVFLNGTLLHIKDYRLGLGSMSQAIVPLLMSQAQIATESTFGVPSSRFF